MFRIARIDPSEAGDSVAAVRALLRTALPLLDVNRALSSASLCLVGREARADSDADADTGIIGCVVVRVLCNDDDARAMRALGAYTTTSRPPPYPWAYVTAIAVRAVHRGRGLGTALMRAAAECALAPPIAATVLCLHAKAAAADAGDLAAFYRRCGLQLVCVLPRIYRAAPAGWWSLPLGPDSIT